MKEEAAHPEKDLPPVTPRYSWPGEALTFDEIRERITVWRVDPKLRQRIDAHNQLWRRGEQTAERHMTKRFLRNDRGYGENAP